MDTAAIRYRVADFLKQHPPFTAMEERDLVALAANGRVRFHEVNEFILWQGEPHKAHVFVIQQGTVSIWDEHTGEAALRDVRGAGDLLGAEQFNGARSCLFSARAAADVVLYGFPAEDFGELLEKYPYARQFVDALGTVATEFQRAGGGDERSDPRRMFLHDVASPLQACTPNHSVADAARMLALTGAEALAVTGADAQLLGLVTTNALLSWIADGGGSADRPIAELGLGVPPTLGPDASIADGVIAMGNSAAAALAMTADGTSAGRLLAVVTPRDLAPVFGDAPAAILRDVGRASDLQALRTLNQRARACALQYLTSAGSTDWIVRFIESVDLGILRRLIAMTSAGEAEACWCVCGASGRGESVTRRQPHLIVIGDDRVDQQALIDHHARVVDALAQCDYLPEGDSAADAASAVAGAAEWSRRYRAWIENPVMERMARSRSLFDLRPFHGDRGTWTRIRDAVAATIDRDIVQVLAHDCLANLPPLTFYQDGVIEQGGEQSGMFRLEHSALAPLVDLGRVFGMAARDVMGTSTLDRFAIARRLLPAHEAIFRDAAETLRIVLWQQGRAGISQRTDGSEVPPSLLSRHDRHMLKSGFPVIHRLIEFSADPAWLDAVR